MLCPKWLKYLWLFVFIIVSLPADSCSDEFAWGDYKRAFATNIKVCSSRQAIFNVNIPSDVFNTQKEHLSVVLDINKLTTRSYVNYLLFVNRHRYKIKTSFHLGDETVEVKIKTKHLEIGKNIIKASTSLTQSWGSPYCAYEIKKIYFKELSSASTRFATSKASGEDQTKPLSPYLGKTTLLKSLNVKENSDAVAVIIGNQVYENKDIPPVKYAVNDALAVKRYLMDTLGYRDGNIIFNNNASKADLEMIFGTERNYKGMLYNYIKPQKSDVFIYYSGHGSPDPNTQKAYLVPNDCNPVMMDLTAYPLDTLYGNLPKIEAKRLTVVIDACFSGGTNSGEWLVPNASPALLKVKNPITTQNNLTIFTSAENNQVSSWYPEKQHSLFTYFFLRAVTGDADENKDKKITYQEIYDFTTDRAEGVPYYAKRLHGGRMQTPTMQTAKNEAVFVTY